MHACTNLMYMHHSQMCTCLLSAIKTHTHTHTHKRRFVIGLTLFAGTYYSIILIIRERLSFFIEMARDSNAKQSIKFLKTGVYEKPRHH